MRTQRVVMREARWEDLEGIWRVCVGHHEDFHDMSFDQFRDVFAHRWLGNPARTAAHPFGWVLADGESVHGFLGLVPVVFRIAGEDVVGASGTTWVVDPAFRARSLELYMQYMAWGDCNFLIDTTAGEVAGKCHAALHRGMRHVPLPGFGERLLWIWKPSAIADKISARLSARVKARWWAVVPAKRLLVTLAARIRFLPHRTVPAQASYLSVEDTSFAPPELDALWNRHRDSYGVTTKRDFTFVSWRVFGSAELRSRTRLLVCRRHGVVVAYLILYRKSPQHFLIADLFPMKDEAAARKRLIRRAWELARNDGGAVLEVYGFHPELMDEVRTLRPYAMRADLWTYWYKTPSGSRLDQMGSNAEWWPSGVDGDINM